jgi:hypothetical protein
MLQHQLQRQGTLLQERAGYIDVATIVSFPLSDAHGALSRDAASEYKTGSQDKPAVAGKQRRQSICFAYLFDHLRGAPNLQFLPASATQLRVATGQHIQITYHIDSR